MNLSSYPLTQDEVSVLSKGLTFVPANKLDKFEVIKDLHLYTRKLLLKSMFEKTKPDMEGCRTFSERQGLDNLNSLLEESEPKDLIDMIGLESPRKTTAKKSSLKKTSSLYPAPSSNHSVATFLKMTCQEIKSLKSTSPNLENLTRSEKIALKNLSSNHEITIKDSDKGGNIVLMDNDKYSRMCIIF